MSHLRFYTHSLFTYLLDCSWTRPFFWQDLVNSVCLEEITFSIWDNYGLGIFLLQQSNWILWWRNLISLSVRSCTGIAIHLLEQLVNIYSNHDLFFNICRIKWWMTKIFYILAKSLFQEHATLIFSVFIWALLLSTLTNVVSNAWYDLIRTYIRTYSLWRSMPWSALPFLCQETPFPCWAIFEGTVGTFLPDPTWILQSMFSFLFSVFFSTRISPLWLQLAPWLFS